MYVFCISAERRLVYRSRLHGLGSVDYHQRTLHSRQPVVGRLSLHRHTAVDGVDALLLARALRVPEHADRRVLAELARQVPGALRCVACRPPVSPCSSLFFQLRSEELALRRLRQRGPRDPARGDPGRVGGHGLPAVGQHPAAARVSLRVPRARLHGAALLPQTAIAVAAIARDASTKCNSSRTVPLGL